MRAKIASGHGLSDPNTHGDARARLETLALRDALGA
jgi:hypothetical protein